MSLKPVTRKIDYTTGHGPFPPKLPQLFSPDVTANNQNVVRGTDAYQVHCVGPVCHGSVLIATSQTVTVNNLPIGRLADPLDCNDYVAQGSADVISG